jgi:drug/metabolite transporter (DMT)-like permease
VFWGTGDFISTFASKRVGYYATTVYSCVLSLPVLAIVIALVRADVALTPGTILILVLASVCFLSAYVFAYRGYQLAPLSVVAPIAYTAPAIATRLAVVFLGAKLTRVEVIPLVAIMVGVILLSTRFSELRTSDGRGGGAGAPAFRLGVTPGIIAALSFSFVFVALSAIVPVVGYLTPIFVLRVGGSVVGFALAPILRQHVKPNATTLGPLVWLVAIFDTVGYVFLGAGIGSAGRFLPLVIMTSGMGGLFLVCCGMAFRKEKPEPNQLIGIAVSIVGVASLLYLTA